MIYLLARMKHEEEIKEIRELINNISSTIDTNNFAKTLQDEELSEGVTYLHTKDTGLSKDIIVDCGETYKYYNHPLCIYIVDGNNVTPVTVDNSPQTLNDYQIPNDILEFIVDNKTILIQFANMEIDGADFFNSIENIQHYNFMSTCISLPKIKQMKYKEEIQEIRSYIDKVTVNKKHTILYESEIIDNIVYNNHVLEIKNYDLNNPKDKEYIHSNIDIIWKILQEGYKNIGGFKGFQTKRDLLKKSPFLRLGYCDNEIVTVYNGYLGGNKCVGATCIKDERHEYAVKLLELILKYNIKNWNQWVWIEASGKIEEMCKNLNAFNVPTDYVILYLKSIPYKDVDEYHYSRMISGNKEIKTIFGFKDNESYELIKNDINTKVEDFIKKINNSILKETSSKRDILYQEYMKTKNDLEKYKNIIDYFIYLKDDEMINEFPSESLNILKETIISLQKEIENNKNSTIDLKYFKIAIEEGKRILQTSTELYPMVV